MKLFRFLLLSLFSMPAFGWWVSLQDISPRGHEEISWQGISRAQSILSSQNLTEDGLPFFPVPSRGDSGYSSASYILMGNYSVDRPDDLPAISSDEVMNLRKAFSKYYNIDNIDWHHATPMQALHFMRQFDSQNAWSSRYSCEKGKEVITFASERAVANWTEAFNPQASVEEMKKSRNRALFWIGVALHTIQDSFSPVHVERADGPKTPIKQLCTYEKEFEGVCSHDTVDGEDNVWVFGAPPSQLSDSAQTSAGIIKLPAQMAALATRDYLVKMGMQFKIGMNHADQLLAINTTFLRLVEFFHDSEPEGSGRFWCPISPVTVPDKKLFEYWEKIKVKFTDSAGLGSGAYLGMMRKEAAHVARPLAPGSQPDGDVISWYSFDASAQDSGAVEFDATRAGDWQIRTFSTAGEEKNIVDVTVKPGVRAPSTVAAGATFEMSFGADSRWPITAFVALVPKGTADTAEATKAASTQFLKLNKMEHETVDVAAPPTAGQYELRMFDAGFTPNNAKLVARAPFTVQ